jgi:DNA mismatch endonuclease (patch repair protein)
MMSGIRGKDTKPELLVRTGLHSEGFRFRLHDRKLPGRPDLALARYRAVVFVHGCFWHGHDCHLFKWPKSRVEFWREKIEGNVRRDVAAVEKLLALDWRVGIVWECALKGRTALDPGEVIARCSGWLRSSGPQFVVRGREEGPSL